MTRGQGRDRCRTPSARRGPASSLLLLLTLLLWGCQEGEEGAAGREASSTTPLLILAAADLQAAFEELVPRFEEAEGARVDVVLGSSGNLAAQIRHGAPADLFFSANEAFLDDLIRDGRVLAPSRREYAVGRLALIAGPGEAPPPGLEALTESGYGVVALANPEHAPYGMAAREGLVHAQVWDQVEPRLVLGENIAHTLQFVRTGNADAGLVALGLVRGMSGSHIPHTVIPDSLHAPLRQVAGIVEGTEREEVAVRFLAFVMSAESQATLARFGFESPQVDEDESHGRADGEESHGRADEVE